MQANCESHNGWFCNATICSTSGIPLKDRYRGVRWSYDYGFGARVSISPNLGTFCFKTESKGGGEETILML